MTKKCDNKSVGVLVWNDAGALLMQERMKFPFGWAPQAGNLDDDGDDYETAGIREVKEEIGIDIAKLKLLLNETLDNQFGMDCRRGGGEGPWHHWQVYRAEKSSGEVKRSEDEVKRYSWLSVSEIAELAERAEAYMRGKISESDWEANPGLEVVWYEIFKILEII